LKNLLLTGAFSYSETQIEQLRQLGYSVTFVQDEREPLEIDCSLFEAVVCNGLFLYNNIEKFTSLKFIQATSAGLDRLPLENIRKRNIVLKNAKGVYSIPMAEWCMCQILSVYKCAEFFRENQKQRKWIKNRNLRELNGSTASIIGFGSVGSETAKRLAAFGVKIIAVSRSCPKYSNYDIYIRSSDMETALIQSDIVILTLPLSKETYHLFNEHYLNKIKQGGILVNLSRGAVIDEKALVQCLNSGHLGYAVLDVFEQEPLDRTNELWNRNNVLISPHNSFVSDKNNERMFRLIYRNLREIQQL